MALSVLLQIMYMYIQVNLYHFRFQSLGPVPGFFYCNRQNQTVQFHLAFRNMSDYIHFWHTSQLFSNCQISCDSAIDLMGYEQNLSKQGNRCSLYRWESMLFCSICPKLHSVKISSLKFKLRYIYTNTCTYIFMFIFIFSLFLE